MSRLEVWSIKLTCPKGVVESRVGGGGWSRPKEKGGGSPSFEPSQRGGSSHF